MPDAASTISDVIVVGGGVIGVCSAYYLATMGNRVVLIEQGEICSGCSYGNACLITTSHAVPLPRPGAIKEALNWMLNEESPLLIRFRLDMKLFAWLFQFAQNCRVEVMLRAVPVLRDLCRESLALYHELVRTEGLQFYFKHWGTLYVNSTDVGFEKSRREADLLARYGFAPKVMVGREAHEMEPALLGTVRGAIFHPEDAHGDSHLFVTGLAEVLRKRGVSIEAHTYVSGLLTDGLSQISVTTDRGEFKAKNLVIANGCWAPKLARLLGVNLPVQPAKGYSITIPKPDLSPTIPVAHQERKVITTPIGDRLRFAGTMEFAGMDLRMNNARAVAALRGAREILQPMPNPCIVERWCGLRACTPDGIPIIDRLPRHPNIYIASGHGMLGYTMGPITGRLVSEMVNGVPLSLPASPLSLSRFSRPKI